MGKGDNCYFLFIKQIYNSFERKNVHKLAINSGFPVKYEHYNSTSFDLGVTCGSRRILYVLCLSLWRWCCMKLLANAKSLAFCLMTVREYIELHDVHKSSPVHTNDHVHWATWHPTWMQLNLQNSKFSHRYEDEGISYLVWKSVWMNGSGPTRYIHYPSPLIALKSLGCHSFQTIFLHPPRSWKNIFLQMHCNVVIDILAVWILGCDCDWLIN
jgi:hypothetical protein